MSDAERMLAAALMMCEAVKVQAEIFAMRSNDDWEVKFGSGQIHMHDAYAMAAAKLYDPQIFINEARDR